VLRLNPIVNGTINNAFVYIANKAGGKWYYLWQIQRAIPVMMITYR
jgi:hypothetical protein